MRTKILILGSSGMLGHMVAASLSQTTEIEIFRSARTADLGSGEYPFDVDTFLRTPEIYSSLSQFHYLINCIGVTKPNCRDNKSFETANAIAVNALFPHALSNFCNQRQFNARIIHLSTDGVFSGQMGNYDESAVLDASDVYGRSKALGEVHASNVLNFRCSIIGPSLVKGSGLIEWLRAQPKGSAVPGYTNQLWNGVTTLQYAELLAAIIRKDAFSHLQTTAAVHHFCPNSAVSKYELLQFINHHFHFGLHIEPNESALAPRNYTLTTKFTDVSLLYPHSSIHRAVEELVLFMQKKSAHSDNLSALHSQPTTTFPTFEKR